MQKIILDLCDLVQRYDDPRFSRVVDLVDLNYCTDHRGDDKAIAISVTLRPTSVASAGKDE